MVVLNRDTVISRFCRKGFGTKQGSKEIGLFFVHNGKPTEYRTHCSRGGHGAKLEDFHIKMMADQLNLTKEEFMKFYGCGYVQKDFIRIQAEKRGPDPLDLLK